MKEITVVFKEPCGEPKIISIPANLASLQKCVEGDIEAASPSEELARRGIVAYINDEGKLCGKLPNLWAFEKQDILVGNVLFVGTDEEGGDISLTDEDIVKVMEYCDSMKLTESEFIRYMAFMMNH